MLYMFAKSSVIVIWFLWQADEPQTNFKGRYDEEYRQQHPTAPAIVPWISGVTAS